jgi:hypothetical protein
LWDAGPIGGGSWTVGSFDAAKDRLVEENGGFGASRHGGHRHGTSTSVSSETPSSDDKIHICFKRLGHSFDLFVRASQEAEARTELRALWDAGPASGGPWTIDAFEAAKAQLSKERKRFGASDHGGYRERQKSPLTEVEKEERRRQRAKNDAEEVEKDAIMLALYHEPTVGAQLSSKVLLLELWGASGMRGARGGPGFTEKRRATWVYGLGLWSEAELHIDVADTLLLQDFDDGGEPDYANLNTLAGAYSVWESEELSSVDCLLLNTLAYPEECCRRWTVVVRRAGPVWGGVVKRDLRNAWCAAAEERCRELQLAAAVKEEKERVDRREEVQRVGVRGEDAETRQRRFKIEARLRVEAEETRRRAEVAKALAVDPAEFDMKRRVHRDRNAL